MEKEISFKIKNKKYKVRAKVLKNIFSRGLGLMFRKKSPILLFDFKKLTRLSIHSFFCSEFIAVWLSNGKVVECRVVKPWKINIIPKKEFDKLIEIPRRTKEFERLIKIVE